MSERDIIVGKSGTATAIVNESNTAKAAGSGSLDVFATPMMVALMEKAACTALADSLADGESSVGTAISVAHTAASPLGAKIIATATITDIDGRKVSFTVIAADEMGEIGRGTHTRVIVDTRRFMQKLQK